MSFLGGKWGPCLMHCMHVYNRQDLSHIPRMGCDGMMLSELC